jgi:3-oxoacyl-[acyl-carrier protein] reductase
MTDARVALLTGGGRGIGRACSLALAASGHRVIVNYAHNRAAAEETVAAARALGVEAVAIEADVGDAAATERLYTEATAAFGHIDVLVCNAGIAPLTALDDISLEEWQDVFDINVRSTLLLGRRALREMKARGWGRIVTIASQAGVTGGYFIGAHYAASKGALIALTRSLAKRGAAHGVTANCVAPGLIDTDLTRAFPPEQRDGLVAAIPMKRMGTPEEVGGVVSFLASDAAGYVSGVLFPVDGALLAG